MCLVTWGQVILTVIRGLPVMSTTVKPMPRRPMAPILRDTIRITDLTPPSLRITDLTPPTIHHIHNRRSPASIRQHGITPLNLNTPDPRLPDRISLSIPIRTTGLLNRSTIILLIMPITKPPILGPMTIPLPGNPHRINPILNLR